MPDYVIDRGYPYVDQISGEQARELFERAKADPDSQLDGTLEDGFAYIIGDPGEPHLVPARVRPVKDAEPQP